MFIVTSFSLKVFGLDKFFVFNVPYRYIQDPDLDSHKVNADPKPRTKRKKLVLNINLHKNLIFVVFFLTILTWLQLARMLICGEKKKEMLTTNFIYQFQFEK
jgi:hypothetical protein